MCQDIVAEKEKGEEEMGSAGGEEEEDEEEGGVEVWVKWFGDNQLSKVSPSLSVHVSAGQPFSFHSLCSCLVINWCLLNCLGAISLLAS